MCHSSLVSTKYCVQLVNFFSRIVFPCPHFPVEIFEDAWRRTGAVSSVSFFTTAVAASTAATGGNVPSRLFVPGLMALIDWGEDEKVGDEDPTPSDPK